MTTWTDLWTGNEWVDAEGNELANQDLLQEAWSLDERLRAQGEVVYIKIPRVMNEYAEHLCNQAMDQQLESISQVAEPVSQGPEPVSQGPEPFSYQLEPIYEPEDPVWYQR